MTRNRSILALIAVLAVVAGGVTALIVQDGTAAVEVLPPLASLVAGRTAKVPFVCPVPGSQA